MRTQTIIILGFALVFGGAAAFGVRAFMKSQNSAANADSVSVVMTTVDIPRGGMISAEQVATRQYPKAMVPEGALTKLSLAVNRTVAIPMIKGEPVLDAKLSSRSAGRGLASLIPKGMRAVTIQTPNVATGVAGLIMPGNKVDVMMTVSDVGSSAETGGGSATTLLQNVEILAVDQRVDGSPESKTDSKELRSVTLLVTPQQANLLDLGQNKGILHLSLRNPDDAHDARAQPVTVNDLRFRHEKPWDERITGIIESYAKAQHATELRTAAKAAEVAKSPPVPVVSQFKIRTIRGSSEGSVMIHSVSPNPGAVREPKKQGGF